MKKIFSIVCAVCLAFAAGATDAQLLVQKVDNGGIVPGNTYRVYVHLTDANKDVHAIFGDATDPLSITCTAPFFQHAFGDYSAIAMNPVAINAAPALAFDSWITLGYESSEGNDMWDIGMSFANFNNGNGISTDNGAWFLLPTDEKCDANSNGLVLIAQFTTTGVASGTLNIQGWDGPNNNWQARNLTFTTANAVVFGCTDAGAANYNAQAGFNDGTCEYAAGNNTNTHHAGGHAGVVSRTEEGQTWDVFPNPLREGLVHVQLSNEFDMSLNNVIRIVDGAGRIVRELQVNDGMVIGGNRVSIDQNFAGGTYKVILTQGEKTESKTFVVER